MPAITIPIPARGGGFKTESITTFDPPRRRKRWLTNSICSPRPSTFPVHLTTCHAPRISTAATTTTRHLLSQLCIMENVPHLTCPGRICRSLCSYGRRHTFLGEGWKRPQQIWRGGACYIFARLTSGPRRPRPTCRWPACRRGSSAGRARRSPPGAWAPSPPSRRLGCRGCRNWRSRTGHRS